MTYEEALAKINPDACPNCGGAEFEHADSKYPTMDTLPPIEPLQIQCVNCGWESEVTSYQDYARWDKLSRVDSN